MMPDDTEATAPHDRALTQRIGSWIGVVSAVVTVVLTVVNAYWSIRIRQGEREEIPSTWALIRGPLILGWLAVALFLFWSQQDLLGSTAAFLTTVGVGLGVIVRILTMFEGGRAVADPATRT